MARDFRSETEFGLPVLPSPSGEPVPEGASGPAAITAFTDADSIKAGAAGQESGPISAAQLSHEARAIYAMGDGFLGPGVVEVP